jgi:hypothetical protein
MCPKDTDSQTLHSPFFFHLIYVLNDANWRTLYFFHLVSAPNSPDSFLPPQRGDADDGGVAETTTTTQEQSHHDE